MSLCGLSKKRARRAGYAPAVLLALTGAGCGAVLEPRGEEEIPAEADPPPAPAPRDAARPPSGSDAQADQPDGVRRDASAADAGADADPEPRQAVPLADAGAPADATAQADTGPAVVPVFWIDVGGKEIVPDVKITGRLRVVEAHDGTLSDPAALARLPATVESPIGIEIRGNSSLMHPKKSYGIELRDDAGRERALPVLGMPAESDWVVHACYSDKTCLRNALVYALGREVSPRYSVRARFAEVFIDGKYNGLYTIVEKIKRDKNRVNIPVPAPDAASGDVSGGYIFRREAAGKKPPERNWTSKAGTLYTFHYPRYDRITPAQKAALIGHMDRFEAMMNGPDWAHPQRGYRAWIDVPSFVDWALLNELAANLDAYRKSTYLVLDARANGGKLFMGPIWDFDLGFGNEHWGPFYRGGYFVHVANAPLPPPNNLLFYWLKLWKDPAFQRDARCRWRELRRGPLTVARINEKIDAWVKYLAAAEKRDHRRWPIIGVKVWPNHHVFPTYAEEVKFLRDYIDRHLRWIDANLPGTCS